MHHISQQDLVLHTFGVARIDRPIYFQLQCWRRSPSPADHSYLRLAGEPRVWALRETYAGGPVNWPLESTLATWFRHNAIRLLAGLEHRNARARRRHATISLATSGRSSNTLGWARSCAALHSLKNNGTKRAWHPDRDFQDDATFCSYTIFSMAFLMVFNDVFM